MHDHAAACAVAGNVFVLALTIPIGALIGIAGVGGILLVPLFATAGGCTEHQAIALSLASGIALGIVSLIVRLRRGPRPERGEVLLYVMLFPGTIAGAWLGSMLPDTVLIVLVATAITATGIWTLLPRPHPPVRGGLPGAVSLATTGGGAGLVCALTGAGGPIVVMPVLLVQGVAVREALGVAQVSQLPIALTATLFHGVNGDIGTTAVLAAGGCLTIGLLGGMRIGTYVPAHALSRIAGGALVLAGITMLGTFALHR